MQFTSLKNWLIEAKKEVKRPDYGCVMLYTTVPNWDKHLSKIDKEDIFNILELAW